VEAVLECPPPVGVASVDHDPAAKQRTGIVRATRIDPHRGIRRVDHAAPPVFGGVEGTVEWLDPVAIQQDQAAVDRWQVRLGRSVDPDAERIGSLLFEPLLILAQATADVVVFGCAQRRVGQPDVESRRE